jgi:hypothetical protein
MLSTNSFKLLSFVHLLGTLMASELFEADLTDWNSLLRVVFINLCVPIN